MQIFSRIEDLPAFPNNTVAAIGNFDGVHLGHQKILQFLVKESAEQDLTSLVLTFSPHPEKYFGKTEVRMIQTLDQRLREIEKFNIQITFVLSFSHETANLTSREFVQSIMCDTLNAREIIVGENFRFGKNREGNVHLLHQLSSICGFKSFSIPAVKRDGQIVSSSLIRTHLQNGKIENAGLLLGRPYEVSGTVIKGQSRGKNLGFPTANISTENEIIPPGVFITNVVFGDKKQPSLTNIGTCPTFKQKETNVESYIIGFSGDLYGQPLKIQFLKKLRDEIEFETPEQLAAQISKDLAAAKTYFQLD